MFKLKARLSPLATGLVLALVSVFVLALPIASNGQVPGATVTVCQVTGNANAPDFLEVQVSVDKVAAYLNQHPGSFVGSCPAGGGGSGGSGNPPLNGAVTVCRVSGSASAPVLSEVLVAVDQVAVFLNQNPGSFVGACPASSGGGNAGGPGGGSGPLNAVVTVCRVTGNATALRFAQVNVAIDRVAAFLNQNPGSFVGLCPSSGDPNGTIGNEPLAYVTICRVTGDVDNPLAPVTIRLDQLDVYLTQAGTVVPAATGGCSRSGASSGGGTDNPAEPTATSPGQTRTFVVQTTPNTVVTANGAGTKASTKSNKQGKAKLTIKHKRKGIITVRAAGNRVVKRIGVASASRSGANLTG